MVNKSEVTIEELTITIPTYKRVSYLKKILDSIPPGIKVIVGDNGGFVPETFKKEHPSCQFETREKVIDPLSNWNKCIESVSTEWFMIPSDDDLFYEGSFQILKHYIDKYNQADLLIFGFYLIDEFDNKLSKWVPDSLQQYKAPYGFKAFKYGVEARFPCLVFKTKKFKEQGYFDESYMHTAGDSKLIQKISLNGECVFIPEIVGGYRTWLGSSTNIKNATPEWMGEIARWQDEILPEVSFKFNEVNEKVNTKKIKDEVIARNLLSGINNLKKNKEAQRINAFNFLKSVRFPWKASLTTQIRIVASLLSK